MGWDDNIYYHPEKYGLEPLGEIDWDDEAYNFNLTVLWWRAEVESFYMAEDAGCSCPAPFENHTMESLERVISLTDLKSRLRRRMQETLIWKSSREALLREETDRLLSAARERGMRQ